MNRLQMYQDVGKYSEILGASSHRQIQMLLERALHDIKAAINAIEQKSGRKSHYISHANDIVMYLRDCVNVDAGGTLANKLYQMYGYLERELFFANAHSNMAKLENCYVVLNNIKTWWDKIDG